MNRFIKWMFIGGLGLVGLIIILLIIPLFVNLNTYKPFMEKKVSEATGRTFKIGGDLKLSLFPWAGVSFSDLELGNPKAFEEKTFLKIQSFEVRVKLLPLISRNIDVQKFIVNGPQVTLIKKQDGEVNWQFSPTQKSSSDPTTAKSSPASGDPAKETAEDGAGETPSELPINKLEVGEFAIRKGSLLYLDQATKTGHDVSDVGLVLNDVSFDKPIQFDLSALIDNLPVALTGTIGPVGKDPGRARIPVDIKVSAIDALTAQIAGTVTNALQNPKAELTLQVKPFSLKKVLEPFETAPSIQTADPNALESIGLNAQIKAGQTAVSVTQGELTLDDTHMTFSLNASQFDRPNVAFDFELDQIDLDRYLPPDPGPEEKPTQASTNQGKTAPGDAKGKQAHSTAAKKTYDYDPLRRLILDGRFNAGTIIIKSTTIENLKVAINAKDGLFRINPFSLKAYQGAISGNAAFNVQGIAPSSDLDMRIADLQIAPLVKAQMKKDLIEGTTNAKIKLKMKGDDADLIKQTLNGSGEFRINNGAIVGFDLAAMARNVKSAFGGAQSSGVKPRTDFSELLMPFTIRNGVVATRQTRLKSPFFRVLAAGKADLINETLDFRIEPKAVSTIKGQGDDVDRSGIMVPVLVSGSFTEPVFKPDLKAIAEQQIEKQVFENEEVKKIFEKEELKPYEKPVKDLLKGYLKE